MFRIWKQAWRKDSSDLRVDPEQSTSQSSQLKEIASNGAASESLAAAEDYDHAVGDSHKRRRSESVDVTSHDDGAKKPRKKVKLRERKQAIKPDSIGNILPEVMDDTDAPSWLSAAAQEEFEDMLVDEAEDSNIIAIFPPGTSFIDLIVRVLLRADYQKLSNGASLTARKIAIILVSDSHAIEEQGSELSARCDLAVGTCAQKVNAKRWSQLVRNDVVIIPASVFLKSLVEGDVAMSQVHMLIICGLQSLAEQAVDPVMNLLDMFYIPFHPDNRPRVFAVGHASPKLMLAEMEQVLGCKTYNGSNIKVASQLPFADQIREVVVLYETSLAVMDTKLINQLHQIDPQETNFGSYFRTSRHVMREVGSCACDLTWRRALKDFGGTLPLEPEEGDSEGMSAKAVARNLIKNWVFPMPNLDMTSRGFNVTPKFAQLVQILKSCKPHGESFRGIIFVQRRAVSLAMTEIIRSLDDGFGFLRPYSLVGDNRTIENQHEEIFRHFSAGTYNLLIATKSTEDLHFPNAKIIVRYDLFESHLSHYYVHSLRTRSDGYLIHMVEKNNDLHRRILSDYTKLEADMEKWFETMIRDGEGQMPPRSLKESTELYESDSDDEDETDQRLIDSTTGGRITIRNATVVVYRFAASLQSSDQDQATPIKQIFKIKKVEEERGSQTYVCTVTLPPGLPVRKVTGPFCLSSPYARRQACFRVCSELFDLGLLDYRLFFLPQNDRKLQGSSLGTSQVLVGKANSTTGTRCYPHKNPDFWCNSLRASSHRLYPIIVYLHPPYTDDGWYNPILILGRQPFPRFSDFKLFFGGAPSTLRMCPAAPFDLDEYHLKDLHLYTLRLCRAVANKPFECPLEKMPFFYAPVKTTWRPTPSNLQGAEPGSLPVLGPHIAWDAIALASKSWVVPLNSTNLQTAMNDIQDAIIQDRWVEFTRRYFAIMVRADLTPLSKPEDSPREAAYDNLVEYCKARRKGFEGLQNYDQPLIRVSKVPGVMNRLSPIFKSPTEASKPSAKYLIPELCAKFTIPASTFNMALLLPSITRRIEDFLIAKELNARLFNHALSEEHLLPAICAPSTGYDFDYERLELLGDAFLKYIASVYVFVTNPAQQEGALHVARQRVISNKALHHSARLAGLPQYIQSRPFSYKAWQPYNFTITPLHSGGGGDGGGGNSVKAATGDMPSASPSSAQVKTNTLTEKSESSMEKGQNSAQPGSETANKLSADTPPAKNKKRNQDDPATQWLGDKAIADVAEALIGAAYISGGREIALRAMKALHVPIPHVEQWSDFSRKVLAPPPNVTARLREGSIDAVEAMIGHKFEYPHLLAQALTHSSIQGYEATSYERLEFIGDAILDFMVIRHIFYREGQLSPGGLTLLKGAMVSNSALAAVCIWSGLQEHILLESYSLGQSIKAYAQRLKIKQEEEYERAEAERRSPGQFWLEVEPPKALSDIVESIIGAVYISDNFSPIGAEAFFDNVLKPFYDKHITLKTLSHHPTKLLLELFQAHGCQEAAVIKEKIQGGSRVSCEVVVHNVILAAAVDTTAASAGRLASLQALDAIEGDPGFLARTCDCRARTQAKKAQKKTIDKVLAGLGDDEEDAMAVEKDLIAGDET